MSKPSIILTGATGLVGSRFVELYQDVYEIHNLDLATGVDITNLSAVETFFQSHPASAVIHLAAFTDTAVANTQDGDQSGLCYQVNVVGAKNIALTCAKYKLYLIHVSTDFVFDGQNNNTAGYIESDPVSPLGWYGKTKALAEAAVSKANKLSAIARLSYPYRARFDLKPDIIKKIKTGIESSTLLPQFTDSLITPTFVDDIVRGFDALIKRQLTGIFHLVGSTTLSPYELAQKVASAYDLDSHVIKPGSYTEYALMHPRSLAQYGRISNKKTSLTLGINFCDIDDGLKEILKQQQA